MQLIVAPNLLQHVKHLSEISAVFELNHWSIFTPVLKGSPEVFAAAAPHEPCWQINLAQITAWDRGTQCLVVMYVYKARIKASLCHSKQVRSYNVDFLLSADPNNSRVIFPSGFIQSALSVFDLLRKVPLATRQKNKFPLGSGCGEPKTRLCHQNVIYCSELWTSTKKNWFWRRN